jgi:signal transduction histidine kinase
MGRSIFEFLAPEYHEVARSSISRAIEEGTVQQYLAYGQTDHRAYAVYETIVAPVTEADGSKGAILVAFDVTRTRELEERLKRSEKMESLGTLTAGVAHNFNNLLAVIRPTLELLQEHVDVEGRSFLEEATQATDRAASLIRQLMIFAGTRRPAEVGTCDLAELAEAAVQMCRRLVGPEVHVRFEREAGRFPIRAHGSEIEQVIVNLILNARDAFRTTGSTRGEVRVKVQRAEGASSRGSSEGGPSARVVVEDDGPGIDPNVLPRLFDPFFTTKSPGEGTGLGLAISWSVVEGLGGTIECQSRSGEGARFTVSLPLEAEVPQR